MPSFLGAKTGFIDIFTSHRVQVPLAVMVPFLAAALQGGAEAARGAAIVRSLQRAANLAARTDLITRRQR